MKPETQLQIACVTWFKLKYENRKLGCIVHVANEGSRSAKTGGILKKKGMAPGFPDLIIFKRGNSRILMIELKTLRTGSELSENQVEFHSLMRELGQIVFVCRTIDSFIEIVDRFMN